MDRRVGDPIRAADTSPPFPFRGSGLGLFELFLRLLLERVEGDGPELVEVVAKRLESDGIDLVEPAVSLRPVDDEPRVLQDPQMLGDRGTADRELARQLADGQRAGREARQDRAAGRIAERVELGMLVSRH